MKDSFLICGYPRSRTLWLSHFLSVSPYSICTHEACEFAGSPEEFWANAELYACCCEVYGNSDSANLFVLPSMLALRPLTRVVWIQRPIDEVARSMRNAGMPCDEGSLKTLVDLREKDRAYFDLEVDFHDLVRVEACQAIWELCLPGRPFDYGRWGVYTNHNISYSRANPFPNKQYAKFLEWAKKDVVEQGALH